MLKSKKKLSHVMNRFDAGSSVRYVKARGNSLKWHCTVMRAHILARLKKTIHYNQHFLVYNSVWMTTEHLSMSTHTACPTVSDVSPTQTKSTLHWLCPRGRVGRRFRSW